MRFSSRTREASPIYLLLLQGAALGSAWSLAPDCSDPTINPQYADMVREAMPNAIAMADYASKRAALNPLPPPRGNVLQDMLGAAGETDPTVRALASEWLGKARDTTSTRRPPDQGVIIHCSDRHLTTIDAAQGVFRDLTPGRGSPRVQVSRGAGHTDNACGGQLRAFEYNFDQGHVIALCSDWDGGVLRSSNQLSTQKWRTNGDLRLAARAPNGLNMFETYLSYKILHELMHAANNRQFPARLPENDGAGNQVGELYGYERIAGRPVGQAGGGNPPSANNRQHNADSFALLACVWYFPRYSFTDGQIDLQQVPKVDRPSEDL